MAGEPLCVGVGVTAPAGVAVACTVCVGVGVTAPAGVAVACTVCVGVGLTVCLAPDPPQADASITTTKVASTSTTVLFISLSSLHDTSLAKGHLMAENSIQGSMYEFQDQRLTVKMVFLYQFYVRLSTPFVRVHKILDFGGIEKLSRK